LKVKALFILAPENFRDEEFTEPFDALEDAGAVCDVTGPGSGEFKGMLGMTVAPTIPLEEASAADYDAVIVVGGSGSRKHLWSNQRVLNLVSAAAEDGLVVAGICMSGAVLANAGVLDGKRATVFETPESVEALAQGGAEYVKEPVVADGNVITAEGPGAAADFAAKILEALGV